MRKYGGGEGGGGGKKFPVGPNIPTRPVHRKHNFFMDSLTLYISLIEQTNANNYVIFLVHVQSQINTIFDHEYPHIFSK